MKLFSVAKDGGKESTVTGYWLVELKGLLSVVILRFDDGSRDAFHSHAFDSINWVLRGRLREFHRGGGACTHVPGLWPVVTRRSTFHKVWSFGTTWVLSLRGPWAKTWQEYLPRTDQTLTLVQGRKIL